MTPVPENGQRIYLRGGHEGDPLSFSIRWFVPAGFEADGSSEIQSFAHGKQELMSCLTLLGVSALAVMVGDVIDGTPVFEVKPCTAVNAAEHIVREGQRARGDRVLPDRLGGRDARRGLPPDAPLGERA